jgi:hypothetical protein
MPVIPRFGTDGGDGALSARLEPIDHKIDSQVHCQRNLKQSETLLLSGAQGSTPIRGIKGEYTLALFIETVYPVDAWSLSSIVAGAAMIELTIEGDSKASVQEITELKNFIRDDRLQDVKSVEQKTQPPKPGEMGPELLQVLQVVLAGPAVLALVSCIKRYIEARRPETDITIKSGDRTVVIKTKNAKAVDPKELAQALSK